MRQVAQRMMAFGCLMAPAIASAQTVIDPRITHDVASSSARLAQSGYVPIFNQTDGTLPKDGERALDMPLEAGKTYYFISLCVDDCEGTNMILIGPSGIVEQDLEYNQRSNVLIHTTKERGSYRLVYFMKVCKLPACDYAINIYGHK
ncbi:MAG: hypothetical protein EOO81_10695 [Oxalobacteraceae bacterium]|nr:MAG: hypothetical protein EOO81_10695 [Oxalobacteraceae bacterium]